VQWHEAENAPTHITRLLHCIRSYGETSPWSTSSEWRSAAVLKRQGLTKVDKVTALKDMFDMADMQPRRSDKSVRRSEPANQIVSLRSKR